MRGAFYSDAGKTTATTTSFIDLLADPAVCSRDIPFFQQLGINTLFILETDEMVPHSECMKKLQRAGLYVIIMLNGRVRKGWFTANGNLYRQYDSDYYSHFEGLIDEFQRYTNTLAFLYSSGNDLIYLTEAKAAMRHMKEYIRNKKYSRNIYIGMDNTVWRRYEPSDLQLIEPQAFDLDVTNAAAYFTCGDARDGADLLMMGPRLSTHSYCLTGQMLLPDGFIEQYANYPIPMVLVYGCEHGRNHSFPEVEAIYANNATSVFSGGFIREWFDDASSGARLGKQCIDPTMRHLILLPCRPC